jgi:hypothetical protein
MAKTTVPNSVKCYVTLQHGTGSLLYGYRTRHKIFTTLKVELGITESKTTVGVIYGINSPKPHKVTKINTAGGYSTMSSWASDAQAKALRANDDYMVRPPQIATRGISSSANFKTVYVELPGIGGTTIKYAWNMQKDLFNDTTAAVTTNLGIKAVSANDIPELIWGPTTLNLPGPANELMEGFVKPLLVLNSPLLKKHKMLVGVSCLGHGKQLMIQHLKT